MESIKLLKKGIKVNGKYFSCHYSPASNNLDGNATIYIRSYDHIPKCSLIVENDTDMMTDYFEKDRIRIPPNSPFFKQAEELAKVK
jgi:hypothetical protein